jgi:hypothetical protein
MARAPTAGGIKRAARQAELRSGGVSTNEEDRGVSGLWREMEIQARTRPGM